MSKFIEFIKSYRENSKLIRGSFNNPLKDANNVDLKDRLERQFYDAEAERHLINFDTDYFSYDEEEIMPENYNRFYSFLKDANGKKVLDCCCGFGFTAVKCAKHGAVVTGIDISPKMIELSRKNAELNGVIDQTEFAVMSAQQIEYEDDSFDYVTGIGALHHLNLELAGREISRVLKPGGVAVFIEPRIPYRWLIFARSLMPVSCLESPGGCQLSDEDISQFANHFSDYEVEYHLFLRKLARLPLMSELWPTFDRIDKKLLKRFPGLNRFCWSYVVRCIA